jgi:hypothetical protein
MRIRCALLLAAGVGLALPAGAQTRIEFKEQCGRPTAEYTIQAGDHPGHAFRIEQTDCTPEGKVEIAGVAIQDHKATGFAEMDAGKGSNQWFHVFTVADGSSVYARSQGKANYEGKRFRSSTSRWKFAGGTGKFVKLSGTGSYTCHPAPGGFACQAEGEYSLPSH